MHQMHSLIYESPAISSISGIFLEGQEMFISLSPATHLLISFVLHVIGISLSMFIWHLFPKNGISVHNRRESVRLIHYETYRGTMVEVRLLGHIDANQIG
ncbi:hypothetical protein Q1695_011130 [Nippostrongylus brasiliensis]|nr:hypothetical protein Q1695_011130 [Nippostrongylus brasiliensis]